MEDVGVYVPAILLSTFEVRAVLRLFFTAMARGRRLSLDLLSVPTGLLLGLGRKFRLLVVFRVEGGKLLCGE